MENIGLTSIIEAIGKSRGGL
jgi:hypothetical protein